MNRWFKTDRLPLFLVIVLVIAFYARPSSGQNNDEARLDSLETRVATLEAAVFGTATTTSTLPTQVSPRRVATPISIAQTTMGGSFLDQLPPGAPGELSIVAYKVNELSGIPFILRNNTDHIVDTPHVSAIVRNAGGVSLGNFQDAFILSPHVLNPGDVAIGILLSIDSYPENATVDFEVTESTPEERAEHPSQTLDFEIVSSTFYDNSISGEVRNPSDIPIAGGNVYIVCFNSKGEFSSFNTSWFLPPDPIAPGVTYPFKASMYRSCDRYIVSAFGEDGT